MKFFIDTAEVSEIREAAMTGLVDGVTTNPSLIAKSGRNFLEVVAEIWSCQRCAHQERRERQGPTAAPPERCGNCNP